ncbi:Bile salt export pump, partial [Fragariocoptes setiger]
MPPQRLGKAVKKPIAFLKLFKYASKFDIMLLLVGSLFIMYSSFNIPLVNIVYGLMMRLMNDFVAQREKNSSSSSNSTEEAQQQAQTEFMNESYRLCMIVIAFGVTRLVSLYLALLCFNIAASNQARRVKKLFFRSLLRQEIAWFESNRSGDFALRITSDLTKFEEGIGEKIALCLNALFAWILSIASSFYYGWELTLACLILVPLTVLVTTILANFQARFSIRESASLSHAFNVCHEVISSIRTVLAFGGQQKESQRFEQSLDSAYKHAIHRNVYAGLNFGFTWMSGYLGFALCLLYSTKFYQPEYYGAYDEAQIITILWSAAGCVFLLNRMMPFIEVIQMSRGSAMSIFSVIERTSTIDVTSEKGLRPTHLEAHVKFSAVSFTYPANVPQSNDVDGDDRDEIRDKSSDSGGNGINSPIVGRNKCCKISINAPSDEDDDNDDSDTVNSNTLPSSHSYGSTTTTTTTTTESMSSSANIVVDDGRAQKESDAATTKKPYDEQTLVDVSFEVEAGQTVALVGPSGSGKSTSLALLQRFYNISNGSIAIGGHNIEDLNLGWLRGQFGVVTQEPILFDMSIADNISLGALPGQVVTQAQIEQAARSANAHFFIVRLPNGYSTCVGARGVQLSGGQKQRIAIARALIRQPKILLLDEATSALDAESESVVQRALDQARIGRTTIVVAHRLSTVRNADKIIVFDRGTIVECGTHDELVARRSRYYQIHVAQKHGLDPVLARRDSQVSTHASPIGGAPSSVVSAQQALTGISCGTYALNVAQPGRKSRSQSVYSTAAPRVTGFMGSSTMTSNTHNSTAAATVLAGCGAHTDNTNDFTSYSIDASLDPFDCSSSSELSSSSSDDEDAFAINTPNDNNDDAVVVAKNLITMPSTNGAETNNSARLYGANMSKTDRRKKLDAESLPLLNASGRRVKSLSLMHILRFIEPDPCLSATGIMTSLLMGLCIPVSAMIIGDIANIFSTDQPEQIRHGLWTHGLLYAALAIFAFVICFVQVLSFGVAGEKIGKNLRTKGFQAILRRPLHWFDLQRNNPGAICGRLASDVNNVQSITGSRTAVIFQSISILVTTFIFALYFNLKFSSVCAIFVAILLASTVLQARYAGKLTVYNRELDAQIGKLVVESASNIKTLASLHQEAHFIDKFTRLLDQDRRCYQLDNHLRLLLESLKYAMTAISKGSSFYFAAHMLLRDEITIAVIFKLIEIILYGLTEASKSLIFISDLEKARRGAQNLYKLIVAKSTASIERNKNRPYKSCLASHTLGNSWIQKPAMGGDHQQSSLKSVGTLIGVRHTPVTEQNQLMATNGNQQQHYQSSFEHLQIEGKIEFSQVNFCYPSRPDAMILKSLSAELEAGKTIALVGSSGSGKSTVVQLLQRFYEYSHGHIRLDGYELRDLPVEWVRRQMALVSQEPTLLSYTIGDNIRYGDNTRPVGYDEVREAARIANIDDFIMSLPDGYDTKLNDASSVQLSGGQKQRIAIARALIRRAPILIFDEATSALDTESESVVQRALDQARIGRTTIVVAHRLSTVRNADKIIVFDRGTIVECGTHDELVARRSRYYQIHVAQKHGLDPVLTQRDR